MRPFTRLRSRSVAALGEERLIQAIRRWVGSASPPPPGGIGDDCAVLPRSDRRQLLTVDPVIYRRHFDDAVPPEAVGAKLLKRNLSDLAAMGGRPTAAVLALALDPRVRLDWLERFYRGLAACARRYRVALVGGDVAQENGCLSASLTLLGRLEGKRALTRFGARVGDRICVTGRLGGSRAGGRHYKFRPRLAEGAWLACQGSVRAMTDLSDGLAKDLRPMTPPGARPALFPARIPRRPGASLAAALGEGEDYELAFALAGHGDEGAFFRAWKRAFPRLRLTRVGYFAPADSRPAGAIDLAEFRGYEHLR